MTSLSASGEFEFRELSVVLAARNHNPTMATPDFLKGSGVVPADWELARPPVLAQGGSQIAFKNGIRVEARPGRVTFSEGMGKNKPPEEMGVPDLALRYAAALPNLEYGGVGVNPRYFATFEAQLDGARLFIREKILCRGGWQEFGIAPVQAGVNLVFTLERCQLRLGISEVRLKLPEREVPAVAFAGNFDYRVGGESPQERLEAVRRAVGHWQEDMAAFEQLIRGEFLTGVGGGGNPSFA